jgi:ankyrin repeat protein
MQNTERTSSNPHLDPGVSEHQQYSADDVCNATRHAFLYKPILIGKSTIEEDVPGAVHTLHILTSDEAWGMGRTHLVKPYFKIKVRTFLRDLLRIAEPIDSLRDRPSVVNFIVANFNHMHDPDFVIMLRAYILAFPNTRDLSGVELGDGDKETYTALLLAARDKRVPVSVLKTLLEGGVDVDVANDSGDTALMVAVENIGTASCEKVRMLIEYGADISHYNHCFHNAMHLAVFSANVCGLRVLLDARETRLPQTFASWTSSNWLRKTGPLDPDPLHLPDDKYITPLGMLMQSKWINYKTRMELLEMLVSAGAGADSDIDSTTRIAAACATRGPYASPRFFGVITARLLGPSIIVHAVLRKNGYTVNLRMASAAMLRFIDKERSVLPPVSMANFSIENLLLCCINQKIDFDADVGGIDLDIHFNSVGGDDTEVRYTEVVPCDSGARFKLALRFPRGPCPLNFWVEDGLDFAVDITVDRKYTLAHRAVMYNCPTHRRMLISLTRPLCNPLLTCSRGFTAVELLQHKFEGVAMDWDLKRLLTGMCKDRDGMLAYIHKDAFMFVGGVRGTITEQVAAVDRRLKTTKKSSCKKPKTMKSSRPKRSYTNPFDQLSGDTCTKILSYVIL